MSTSSPSSLARSAPLTVVVEPFPLNLAPFEKLMLLDNRPQYPMAHTTEMIFDGEFTRAAPETALATALARHPLLRARVEPGPDGLRWVAAEPDGAMFDFGAESEPLPPSMSQSTDLSREPGLRIAVRVGRGRSYALFQVHHAVCDGLGMGRFIVDLLTAYTAEVASDKSPIFDKLDPGLLERRTVFKSRPAAGPAGAWRTLREAWGFHTCSPQPLAMPGDRRPNTIVNPAWPAVEHHAFSLAESQAISDAVTAGGGTLNDLGLALLFRTLAAWNARYGRAETNAWLRILMPASLRERADLRMPAANRLGLCFIARRPGQCRDWTDLLTGIQNETRYIRQTRLAIDFLQVISALENVPGVLRAFLLQPRSLATAVLTNLSDPGRELRGSFPLDDGRIRFGNVVLERITASPPLRPGTRAAFGIGTYAGRIVLNARCDPWLFTADDTRRLLGLYVAAWQRYAADRA